MAVKKTLAEREQSIHVMISKPISLRKDILTLTIDVIELLKKYEAIKDLRKHKEELMKLLRVEASAIKLLTKQMNLEELPLTMQDLETMPEVKKIKAIEAKQRKEIAARWREAQQMGEAIDAQQKAFIEESEAMDAEEERKEAEERQRAERMAIKIEKAKRIAKEKPKKREVTPAEKLEADLEAIRAKLARI